MIPEADFLEQYYPAKEVGELLALKRTLLRMPESEREEKGRAALRELWPEERLWIEKTHFIKTKGEDGEPLKQLRLNYAQERAYAEIQELRRLGLPVRMIVLKARQLGFSTLIQSLLFEQVDRQRGRGALTISYDELSTTELFGKGQHVHRHQWFARRTRSASTTKLEFSDNGSSIHARTAGNQSAGRGDTYQYAHFSEVPMWASAGETLTSAKQAVPLAAGTMVFIESTAKGAVGEFYDAWNAAERGEGSYRPFFAPWFWDTGYSLDFTSDDEARAFGRSLDLTERRLQESHRLTLGQLRWRRLKIADDLEGSEARFRQEFPSSAKEAFLTTGSPVFNADRIALLEENATRPLWIGDIILEH